MKLRVSVQLEVTTENGKALVKVTAEDVVNNLQNKAEHIYKNTSKEDVLNVGKAVVETALEKAKYNARHVEENFKAAPKEISDLLIATGDSIKQVFENNDAASLAEIKELQGNKQEAIEYTVDGLGGTFESASTIGTGFGLGKNLVKKGATDLIESIDLPEIPKVGAKPKLVSQANTDKIDTDTDFNDGGDGNAPNTAVDVPNTNGSPNAVDIPEGIATGATRDSIQSKLDALPGNQGNNLIPVQLSDGSFTTRRRDVDASDPVRVTEEGDLFSPVSTKPQDGNSGSSIRDRNEHHQEVVDDVKDQLTNDGFIVSDREVSFGSSCGTGQCRPDIIATAPDGSMRIIEIKTGDADLSIRCSFKETRLSKWNSD